ncbi:hypothetical protein [Bacillus atrophaeus]|uniref:hypothetical protein n=1 Tax=Bacillus atrophaeus TaxID=1452 RepID=UPI002E1A51CA|nr:hypothetical protein [Bacillus atrophaeus]MED1030386.1 hypothetical protein [Bacillus atrophaeus]MED1118403.1 hypothetical protein [Bacillus atrophaeus]MED1132991.1 hypothetical protein [Bacillus atrophaeus]
MKVMVIKTDVPLDREAKEKMRVEIERAIKTGIVILDGGLDIATIEVEDFTIVNEPPAEEKTISPAAVPLLQIELDDIDSAPRVFYKGEKIEGIINTDFSYVTNTELMNPTHIDIEYMDKDSKCGTKAIVYNRHFNVEELMAGGEPLRHAVKKM